MFFQQLYPRRQIIHDCNATKHNFSCHEHGPCAKNDWNHLVSFILGRPPWSNPHLLNLVIQTKRKRVENLLVNLYIIIDGPCNCTLQKNVNKWNLPPHKTSNKEVFCLSRGLIVPPNRVKIENGQISKSKFVNYNASAKILPIMIG